MGVVRGLDVKKDCDLLFFFGGQGSVGGSVKLSLAAAGAFDESRTALVSSKLFVGLMICGCGGFIFGWIL
jgi:hypothetical protein